MKQIREEVQILIRQAVSTIGSYHPDDLFGWFGEQLYYQEVVPIYDFLKWVSSNQKTFGWNLPDVYAEYYNKEVAA